jgi:hypothetical protein
MSKLENKIQSDLLKIANNHPKVAILDRANSGKVKVRGGWMMLHKKGFPDACGFATDGRFIGIEFKRPDTKNNTNKDQDSMLDLMNSCNCISGVAWDKESLLEILNSI